MGSFAGLLSVVILILLISNTGDLTDELSKLFPPLPEKPNKSHLAIKENDRRTDSSTPSVSETTYNFYENSRTKGSGRSLWWCRKQLSVTGEGLKTFSITRKQRWISEALLIAIAKVSQRLPLREASCGRFCKEVSLQSSATSHSHDYF